MLRFTDFFGDGSVAGARASLGPVLIVAAHPDDEIVGMGAALRRIPHALVVHITDGAPLNMRDARRLGFSSRDEYASARHEESVKALSIAGIGKDALLELDIPDQTSSYDLAAATMAVKKTVDSARPELIVTHPYEGGHPDHDAAAFATHAAVGLLRRLYNFTPSVAEFTSYHSRNGWIETGAFQAGYGEQGVTMVLSPEQRELKRALLACHASQRAVLAAFPVRLERFRVAPRYDFSRPPHVGPLYYEQFNWGISGSEWRTEARAAAAKLGLDGGFRCGRF